MTTKKMTEAKLAALTEALKDFAPPPRMTTPSRSREKLRQAVEASLKRCNWELAAFTDDEGWCGTVVVEDVCLSSASTGWKLMVSYHDFFNYGYRGTMPLENWMNEAKPLA